MYCQRMHTYLKEATFLLQRRGSVLVCILWAETMVTREASPVWRSHRCCGYSLAHLPIEESPGIKIPRRRDDVVFDLAGRSERVG